MISKIDLNSSEVLFSGNLTPDSVMREYEKAADYRRSTMEIHTAYELEKKVLLYIRNGDMEHLQEFVRQINNKTVSVGRLSDHPSQENQFVFVVALTLYTRAAVEGGLAQEIAYDLSDAYIRSMLHISDPARVITLAITAALDFAHRVRQSRSACSTPVKKCRDYVSTHLYEKITLSDLAACCGKSKSSLSAAFERQLGVSPVEYVLRQKLEAVRKELLTGSTSVSGLAAQYGFCTHSNLTQHFRKYYGISPSEYRRRGHGPAEDSLL